MKVLTLFFCLILSFSLFGQDIKKRWVSNFGYHSGVFEIRFSDSTIKILNSENLYEQYSDYKLVGDTLNILYKSGYFPDSVELQSVGLADYGKKVKLNSKWKLSNPQFKIEKLTPDSLNLVALNEQALWITAVLTTPYTMTTEFEFLIRTEDNPNLKDDLSQGGKVNVHLKMKHKN